MSKNNTQPKAKFFEELTAAECYEILKARAAVFVVEQEIRYLDMDDTDYDSLHIFYQDGKKVTAYLRAFYRDRNAGVVQLGRVLTIERGCGLGAKLLDDSVRLVKERMDAKTLFVESMSYATGFYERAGFRVCSEEFIKEGVPHKEMERAL